MLGILPMVGHQAGIEAVVAVGVCCVAWPQAWGARDGLVEFAALFMKP